MGFWGCAFLCKFTLANSYAHSLSKLISNKFAHGDARMGVVDGLLVTAAHEDQAHFRFCLWSLVLRWPGWVLVLSFSQPAWSV